MLSFEGRGEKERERESFKGNECGEERLREEELGVREKEETPRLENLVSINSMIFPKSLKVDIL